jgi:hypothetical protein
MIVITVFAQWDFPLHYKNKRYVPPIKFVENQNNLGNTSVTHGMTLYRKGKCLGANSLLYVQLISKLSSTPQKSRNRFITTFSPCKHAFLKFQRHIFYIG